MTTDATPRPSPRGCNIEDNRVMALEGQNSSYAGGSAHRTAGIRRQCVTDSTSYLADDGKSFGTEALFDIAASIRWWANVRYWGVRQSHPETFWRCFATATLPSTSICGCAHTCFPGMSHVFRCDAGLCVLSEGCCAGQWL